MNVEYSYGTAEHSSFNIQFNVECCFVSRECCTLCTLLILVFARGPAPHIGSSVSRVVLRWPARLRYLEHSIQQILPRAMKSATQQGTSQQCETTNRDPRISDGHGGCVPLSLESPSNLPRISPVPRNLSRGARAWRRIGCAHNGAYGYSRPA